MKRREFISSTALLPILATQGMSSVFATHRRAEPCYRELLRSATFLGDSELITDDMVAFLLEAIANIEPRKTVASASMGYAETIAQDQVFAVAVEAFINEFSHPKEALTQFKSDPEYLLQRPKVQDVVDRVAQAIQDDAIVFLSAADRLMTEKYIQYLPRDLPVARVPKELAEEARECVKAMMIEIIVAIILITIAVVLAAVTFGATTSLIVVATILVGSILGDELNKNYLLDEIDKTKTSLVEKISKSASKRSVVYAGEARKIAKKCLKQPDPEDRRACLEAALLLCANAY